MSNSNGVYRRFLKRPMDFTLSLLAIIVFSPMLLVVSILVKVRLGSPILFKQERPGLNEEVFTLYKFRSMTDDKDSDGELLSDEERLTNFGRLLRSTSLDELPGLFNILKGDMSIVGPRPLLIKYLPYYSEKERIRHNVRPGLTGLSQVNGRNLLKWDRRLELDVNYVEKISFLKDIQIIFHTFKNVVLRKDIAIGDRHVMQNLDVERGTLNENNEVNNR